MADYTNQTKNASSFTNEPKPAFGSSLTWEEATFEWDEAGNSTWEEQFPNQHKHTSNFTNETKH